MPLCKAPAREALPEGARRLQVRETPACPMRATQPLLGLLATPGRSGSACSWESRHLWDPAVVLVHATPTRPLVGNISGAGMQNSDELKALPGAEPTLPLSHSAAQACGQSSKHVSSSLPT